MVDIRQLNDSTGEEGGLYMLPIIIHLFKWRITLKIHSQFKGSTEGITNLDTRPIET